MYRVLKLNAKFAFAPYLLLDIFCVGAGMGVPIFSILLGFPVGWYIGRRAAAAKSSPEVMLGTILLWALITSAVTFLGMTAIWGSFGTVLFDPQTDFTRLGIPFILYDPKASFIGWLVLMVFISPFLQLLATIFAAHLSLLYSWRAAKRAD